MTSSLSAEWIRVPNDECYKNWPDVSKHPGNRPYISHLNFRSLGNHIIDQTTEWFNPNQVAYGDIIYLNIWYLDWFTSQVHDRIQHPYILVTADVGNWLPDPVWKKLLYDPKLAAWFCRNMIFSYHPKLYQLPMGQDWALFGPFDVGRQALVATMSHPEPKTHLLYMNHYPREHGDRLKLVPLFENEPYCLSKNHTNQEYEYTPYPLYYKELSSCYFTLSPLGWETDCVRTWEAIVLGTIPIVEHTFLDPSYADLPVLIIDDWKEINALFLEKKYEELKNKDKARAYFDYWENLIRETQQRVISKDHFFSHIEATAFSVDEQKDLSELLSGYNYLIYKGFLSSVRPLQLAQKCDDLVAIFLYDPWLDTPTFNNFPRYLNDVSLFASSPKICVKNDDPFFLRNDPIVAMRNHPNSTTVFNPYAVFLDLSYYRHSLVSSTDDFANQPRDTHLLFRDLINLYQRVSIFTFLCGNMHEDPYVRKALEKFADETGAKIEYKGSFWYTSVGN